MQNRGMTLSIIQFGMTFSREFNSADLPLGIIFSRISCAITKNNNDRSHMIVFVTLFDTNFIEIQQCI